jgi:prevent-host-death family protein
MREQQSVRPAPPRRMSAKQMNSSLLSGIFNGQRELRNQSAAVLREVEAGQTIIVSRNGMPVGELRPIRRRHFVP